MATEGSYLWEEPEKQRNSGGKGAGKHAATLLAQEVQLAGEAAEEARRNREAFAAAPGKTTKSPSQNGDFVGEKQVLEFACDASFMQGREEGHLDRHVMVKDLVAASKALKMPLTLEKPVALFAIYDGHFGTKCSEFSAQNFHKKLLPRLGKAKTDAQITESLAEAVLDLDREFVTKFRTDRSGCCVQLALLVGRKLFVGQLGSGGAVLCEGDQGGFTALAAEDLEMEEERIQKVGGQLLEIAPGVKHVAAADFEQRLKEYRIQVAQGLGCTLAPPMTSPFPRAIGDRELKPMVNAQPQVHLFVLETSHTAFALYCDGISDMMNPEEIAKALREMCGQEKRAPGKLTQDAYNRGSEQNLTAITVFFRFPKRSHAQAFPAPTPPPPEPPAAPPAPARAEPPVKAAPAKAKGVTEAELREIKAARREKREQEPSKSAAVEQLFIFAPQESNERKLLEAAGQLCEDEDGHLAHEFLEESADGLRLVAGKRI